MKHRWKYFIHFLASYIIIFAIPLIYIVFFFTNEYMTVLKEEIEEKQQTVLESVRDEFDRNLSRIDSTHTHIQLNKAFKPMYNLSDGNRAREIISEINSYLISNDFISSIAIYYKEDIYIYDESSSCEIKTYFDGYYEIDGWHGDNVYDRLNTIGKPTLFRAINKGYVRKTPGQPCLLLAIPLKHYNTTRANGMIFYRIDEQELKKIMGLNTDRKYTAIFMTDKNGETLSSLYNPDLFTDGWDSNRYIKANLESQSYSIDFISYLSKDSYGALKSVQKRFLISVTLIFLFACASTYVSMKLNYNPIQRLFTYGDMIKEKMNVPQKEGEDNFDSLIHTLDYLFTESSNTQKVNDYADETSLAKDLIQGKITTQKQLFELTQRLGFNYEKKQYTVITIHLHLKKHDLQAQNPEITEKLITVIKENINAIVFCDIDVRRLVIPSWVGLNREELRVTLRGMHNNLKRIINSDITIGVGGIYYSPGDMAKAYQDSLIALDYMLIHGSDQIIFYKPEITMTNNKEHIYPHKQLDTLYYQILQLDKEGTQKILSELISFIRSDKLPLFIIKRVCFDLINITYKAINEISSNILVSTNHYPVPTDLANFQTIDDIVLSLNGYFEKLYTFIDLYKESHSETLIESMYNYIQKNCYQYDFSVQAMGDSFDMSLANISQLFKKKTGQNIIDYTTHLRIEKAKELLRDTDRSVNDIVLAVGYASTSSFIRRFRQHTGYTPRQFADLNERKSET